MAAISEKVGLRLRAVAFVSSLMVVLIHCHSMIQWFAGVDNSDYCAATIYFLGTYTFSRIAVPIFFVLTGFFLVKGWPHKGWWVNTVRKRIISLYVPFILWNILNVAIAYEVGEGCENPMAKVFGWNPWIRLGCMQFWYLQAVFIYTLLAPLILPLLASKVWSIAFLSILGIGWLGSAWYYLPLPLAVGNYMWMSIGSWVGLNIKTVQEMSNSLGDRARHIVVWTFLISIVVKIAVGLIRWRLAFDITDRVLVVMGVLAVFLNLRAFDFVAKRLRSLMPLSFFVFAAHTLVLSFVLRMGMLFGMTGLALYVFKAVVTIILTLGVGWVSRRATPRLFHLFTGGRG